MDINLLSGLDNEKNNLYLQNAVNTNNDLTVVNEVASLQTSFLGDGIKNIANNAIDIGLRAILPDFIEDEVIDVKNTLVNEGLQEGLKTAIDSAINIGKSVVGIFTGKFENMGQVESVVKEGGLLDSISKTLSNIVNKAVDKKFISKNTGKLIIGGKDLILNNIDDKLGKELKNQNKKIENLNKYTQNWNKYYNEKNFEKMEKEYKKIQKSLSEVMPLETLINNAKKIENIHNLIKNNGHDFNLSKEEIELAGKL